MFVYRNIVIVHVVVAPFVVHRTANEQKTEKSQAYIVLMFGSRVCCENCDERAVQLSEARSRADNVLKRNI